MRHVVGGKGDEETKRRGDREAARPPSHNLHLAAARAMLAKLGTPAARGAPKKEEEKTWAGRVVVGWPAGGRVLVRVGLGQVWRVTPNKT